MGRGGGTYRETDLPSFSFSLLSSIKDEKLRRGRKTEEYVGSLLLPRESKRLYCTCIEGRKEVARSPKNLSDQSPFIRM